jgi:carbon monoxide dehydrogenase subunit G
MLIESTPAIVQVPITQVFDFLKDVSNLYHLLPHDKISSWEANETACSFKIQGGIIIPLVLTELNTPTQIKMISGPKSPFPFTLSVNMEEVSGGTKGCLVFDAKVSKTIQFIAEKPLRNLFNTMADKLANHYAQ